MNHGSLANLIGHLREAVRPAEAQALTDADLLRRWLKDRDEAAFELLVWRHGRLVLSVCRRMLDSAQDVEDAFQATFLVLVRKAAGIARKQAVASWLHTVAQRIATEARERSARRPRHADALDQLPGPAEDLAEVRELRRVLDEEVSQLPERYRLPFVLCHLDGKTNEEAAREIGCPVGTVLSRLSRARERLRVRLTRRGIAPSTALVGPSVIGEVLSAELVSSTARVAAVGAVSAPVASLVEGALRTMFFAKLKASLAVVLSVAIVGVGGGIGYRTVAAQDGEKAASPGRVAQGKGEKKRSLEEQVDRLRDQLIEAEHRARQLQNELEVARVELASQRMKAESLRVRDPERTGNVDPSRATAPTLEDRDRVEILRAKVGVKEAELAGAKLMLDEAKVSAQRAQALFNNGQATEEAMRASRTAIARHTTEIKVKEAELLEATLLMRQAERRLKPVQPPAAPARTLEQRMDQVEKQLGEIRSLLQQMQRGRVDPDRQVK